VRAMEAPSASTSAPVPGAPPTPLQAMPPPVPSDAPPTATDPAAGNATAMLPLIGRGGPEAPPVGPATAPSTIDDLDHPGPTPGQPAAPAVPGSAGPAGTAEAPPPPLGPGERVIPSFGAAEKPRRQRAGDRGVLLVVGALLVVAVVAVVVLFIAYGGG
jgi:hypothetical protein